MKILFKNGIVYVNGNFKKSDVLIQDGIVVDIQREISLDDVVIVDLNNLHILPGFADVHVHLREPGFFYKETILSGTNAAAKGGFTLVCSMPNLNPVPDSVENLKIQQDIIDRDAVIKVLPHASITKKQRGKELVDFESLSEKCFAFSDDGRGIQSREIMKEAMEMAKKFGKAIVAHCEDESLVCGGYIHDGEYAKLHGHKGISSASEYKQVQRDVELCEEVGGQYHVCHISTKETVDIVRNAKSKGLKVSCETTPHYLTFCDMDLKEEGRFKMNPPIRSSEDRDALIEGIKDGTIEMIATDHAPHTDEEKSKGLKRSNMGVVGLETSFAVINTFMVNTGHISFEKLVELMSINPRKIFGLEYGISVGKKADFTIVDRNKEWIVNPDEFISKGKSTPFEGMKLIGDILFTICDGKIVYNKLININEGGRA